MPTAEPDTTRHLTIRCQFCETWNRVDAARAADRPKYVMRRNPCCSTDRSRHVRPHDCRRQRAVLVDFYADWCGPCKMMAPFVDELAREKQGTVLIAKLDTDRSQRTASGFNIRGIPTVIVFKDGKAARQTGAVPKKGLEELLARV